jgi:hypothetical protein
MWLFPQPERGGLDPGKQAERPPLREALTALAGNKAYPRIAEQAKNLSYRQAGFSSVVASYPSVHDAGFHEESLLPRRT